MSETPTFDTGPLYEAMRAYEAHRDEGWVPDEPRSLELSEAIGAEAQKLAEQAYWTGEMKALESVFHDGLCVNYSPEKCTEECQRCKRLADARRRAGGAV